MIKFSKKTRRPLVPLCDVPKKFQGDFDYTSEEEKDDNRFFCYKGFWYDLTQFMRVEKGGEFDAWDGIMNESFSSGAVVKLTEDDDVFTAFYYVAEG